MPRILNIVGARPNFMKIAPLMKVMRATPGFDPVLVHTGQHYDDNLSRVFFDDLGIPHPDLNLGVGSGTREEQIAAIQAAFDPVVAELAPDAVLVVGDVNSTIACASVAREKGVPVVHVEAGLRSFDPTMPEELNRRETDQISDYLFVTEPSGLRNLEAEGVAGKCFLVGNVMIDTLVTNLRRAAASPILDTLSLAPREFLAATFHRPSNVDERHDLARIIELLAEVTRRLPVVLPLHPRTRHSLERHDMMRDIGAVSGLHLTDPLGYLDFLKLVSSSAGVVTDSGGIQEETTYLRVPCLTMRANTERPVTVDVGSNRLIGDDLPALYAGVDEIVAGTFDTGTVPELWDGHTAERIVRILEREMRAPIAAGAGAA